MEKKIKIGILLLLLVVTCVIQIQTSINIRRAMELSKNIKFPERPCDKDGVATIMGDGDETIVRMYILNSYKLK
jgi:hypothetical protein